ncbi:MAG: excinuclease ABC subunit A, partial [Armatimonadia bacterium]
EGGAGGGLVVAEGTPEELLWDGVQSPTAEMLREVLGTGIVAHGRKPVRKARKSDKLIVRGAREHNLKNVQVEIPRRKLTVISGVSGSGKTSLALDTLYAEGQRRFMESLSSYARMFMGQMQKPKVERIAGLPPAIAIDQTGRGYSPRSTVGTTTEIYDYLRVLFARLGQPHCPKCEAEVGAMTVSQIVDAIQAEHDGQQVLLCAPLVPEGNEEYGTMLARAQRDGWARARVDGEVVRLPYEGKALSRRRKHDVQIVVDRVTVGARNRSRLAEAVEAALKMSDEVIVAGEGQERRFSKLHSCSNCGASYEPITPRSFSFNHYAGWCRSCYGLGTSWDGATVCPDCHGARVRPEAAAVRLRGRTILDMCNMPLRDCAEFFRVMELTSRERVKAQEILPEIKQRLQFLNEVGLDYLTLSRTAPTLSGGEAQRVKLAGQLGCGLTGVMYVLDEPTVGVHPADNDKMLAALKKLRDEGNTVVVVEHDPQTFAEADYIIDVGPGAGPRGGRIVAAGTPAQVARKKDSVTGQLLAGKLTIPVPQQRRPLPPPPFS